MGRHGKRKSLRALACAYDAGIIHFDVARSYGFGEAENLLGKFIRDKRSEVCLVTKFGILPQSINPLLRLAKPVVRVLMDAIPAMRARVRRSSNQFLVPGNFSIDTARASLEKSLSKLGVETIDMFLIHECTVDTPIADDLFDFLDRCIVDGKIRHYGLATDPSSADTLIEQFSRHAITVTQTPLTPTDSFERLALNSRNKAHIVHGVGALQPILTAAIRQADGTNQLIPDEIHAACMDPSKLMQLLLRYASHKSCGGVTLVSSFNPQHIAENARTVTTPLSDETSQALDRILSLPQQLPGN
jgi:aryl-alcohol dehydrogenase-like predicted oxidoreductase